MRRDQWINRPMLTINATAYVYARISVAFGGLTIGDDIDPVADAYLTCRRERAETIRALRGWRPRTVATTPKAAPPPRAPWTAALRAYS